MRNPLLNDSQQRHTVKEGCGERLHRLLRPNLAIMFAHLEDVSLLCKTKQQGKRHFAKAKGNSAKTNCCYTPADSSGEFM